MRDEAVIQAIAAPDFLSLWDTLAYSKTCPELKVAWSRILDHATTDGTEGLNELWDFYLERLGECEREEGNR